MRLAWIIGIAVAIGLALVGCTATELLPAVKLDPALAPPAPPPILGAFAEDPPISTREDWEQRRAPLLRRAFAAEVYGPFPPLDAPARVLQRETIAYPPLAQIATLEQWRVAVTDGEAPLLFNMLVLLPRREAPAPLIVMQNFCGNRAAFYDTPEAVVGPLTEVLWVCDAPWTMPLVEAVFGRHIAVPPYETILSRGYGLAMFYAGDIVADEPQAARAALARLYGADADGVGAIAVWAWAYARAYDVLTQDARIDAERIAIWGHSRNGKAALYAAALDPRFAAVIAHQSGRGGASLSSGSEGESVGRITRDYPHWFAPAFARAPSRPEMDQHQLLALIAPRPVLLGNSRRDAWADPLAAWRAAEAATPVYRLYGVNGFDQPDMRAPSDGERIAYFTRPGLHGVTPSDWRMFLDFLDAQLRRADAPQQHAQETPAPSRQAARP